MWRNCVPKGCLRVGEICIKVADVVKMCHHYFSHKERYQEYRVLKGHRKDFCPQSMNRRWEVKEHGKQAAKNRDGQTTHSGVAIGFEPTVVEQLSVEISESEVLEAIDENSVEWNTDSSAERSEIVSISDSTVKRESLQKQWVWTVCLFVKKGVLGFKDYVNAMLKKA